MKNSLIKFLDYDEQNQNKVKMNTQPTVVFRQLEQGYDRENEEELSVYTPLEIEAVEQKRNLNSRENLHLLLISDDLSMIHF
jgi:hypothetical protein